MASQPRKQRIVVEDIGDITVVNFTDKKILDEQNISMIGDELFRLVDELGRLKLLLNFSNVEFMSSAALGKLIRLHQRLDAVGGKLVLCKISKNIYDIFELTRVVKKPDGKGMIRIVDTEQEGLESF
jgi:anti-sigma B factor antagonist